LTGADGRVSRATIFIALAIVLVVCAMYLWSGQANL
jgi:hypothetical protein